jgi:hypothetical protein
MRLKKMNGLVKTAVAAALIGASTVASATSVFDFTYTFADGQQVIGDFTGVTTNGGQSVTDIGNIQVQLNGIAFAPVGNQGNATLLANAWNPSTASFSSTATPVTIYANGALNNFIISDVDASTSTSPDYEFAYINDSTNNIYQVVAANFLQSDSFSGPNATQLAVDTPGNASSWKLTEVAPVPIPAALPLLVSGLGLLGFGRRRRVG